MAELAPRCCWEVMNFNASSGSPRAIRISTALNTTVSSGTLLLSGNGALPANSTVIVDANSTFNLNGQNTTLNALSGNGNVTLGTGGNLTVSGNKLTLTNQLMGTTPTFKATFYTTYSGEGLALRLNACTANKLSMPTKIDDWSISELDFMAFADASGTIGYLSTVE